MIRIENEVCPTSEQMRFIIRGMRNPMNSWDKSDSVFGMYPAIPYAQYNKVIEIDQNGDATYIGDKDLDLMKRLIKSGTDHRKFMRMIPVYVDITAPLYWWKEFDTYKVGTVANSCSTMHKIAEKEFTLDDFSCEHIVYGWTGKDKNGELVFLPGPGDCLVNIIIMLNRVRDSYLAACKKESDMNLSAKDIWWQMIQLLPSSYNQKRSVMLNYEVLANMYKSRKNHKLDEWRDFCKWMEDLPFSYLITGEEENNGTL